MEVFHQQKGPEIVGVEMEFFPNKKKFFLIKEIFSLIKGHAKIWSAKFFPTPPPNSAPSLRLWFNAQLLVYSSAFG